MRVRVLSTSTARFGEYRNPLVILLEKEERERRKLARLLRRKAGGGKGKARRVAGAFSNAARA
jgi:hypothetical protein